MKEKRKGHYIGRMREYGASIVAPEYKIRLHNEYLKSVDIDLSDHREKVCYLTFNKDKTCFTMKFYQRTEANSKKYSKITKTGPYYMIDAKAVLKRRFAFEIDKTTRKPKEMIVYREDGLVAVNNYRDDQLEKVDSRTIVMPIDFTDEILEIDEIDNKPKPRKHEKNCNAPRFACCCDALKGLRTC